MPQDVTYHLPYTFPAPRYTSSYDPLSLEDYEQLGYGPSYQLSLEGVDCTIYTDSLNWFLKCKKVEVTRVNDLETVAIDGTSYIESYKTGFLKGIDHFNDKYKFDKYAPILGFDSYIVNLKKKCFQGCYGHLSYPGWEGVRRTKIGMLSHKIISEYGFYSGLYSQVEELIDVYEPVKKAFALVDRRNDKSQSSQLTTNEGHDSFKRPTINDNCKGDLCDILKYYFNQEQQFSLKNILDGTEDGKDKILFSENGNKLADAFKQLYDAGWIVGCQKVEMENWIQRNFMYTDRRTKAPKEFTANYLSKIISSNTDCQSPIIDIKKDGEKFTIKALWRTTKKSDNY